MRSIEIFHLRRVRNKALAVQLLVARAGLTPEAALAVVHHAVGGGKPRVTLAGDGAARTGLDDLDDGARQLIVALADTGFIARRASEDFDPAQHACLALQHVLPRCAPGLADTVGALLLAGDWAQALEKALQHLQMHRPPADADRQRLACAAVDTGLVRGVPGRV